MSERGSFVTQLIYCKRCFKAIKKYFDEKSSVVGHVVQIADYPIWAGNIEGSYSGHEIADHEWCKEDIEPFLCCDMKIAVISDSGDSDRVFDFKGKSVWKEVGYSMPPIDKPLLIKVVLKDGTPAVLEGIMNGAWYSSIHDDEKFKNFEVVSWTEIPK